MNLFCTSRWIPEITKFFVPSSIPFEIKASEQDVQKYLDHNMDILPGYVCGDTTLNKTIMKEIIKSVDGMYVNFEPTIIYY